ncbi:MAG TPA: hypothetical protein VF552_09450 [Allosphingosinicella sp.]|jgi:hypothetical protein
MLSALVALFLLAPSGYPATAVPGRPALVRPIVEPAALCAADPQLVVSVTGFTPPRSGSASLHVSLRAPDGRTSHLGVAGIHPHQAFAAASLDDAQHFGFAVPRAAVRQRVVVVVALPQPAAGASVTIGEARITPAPQQSCGG